jgi:hypothetical protein
MLGRSADCLSVLASSFFLGTHGACSSRPHVCGVWGLSGFRVTLHWRHTFSVYAEWVDMKWQRLGEWLASVSEAGLNSLYHDRREKGHFVDWLLDASKIRSPVRPSVRMNHTDCPWRTVHSRTWRCLWLLLERNVIKAGHSLFLIRRKLAFTNSVKMVEKLKYVRIILLFSSMLLCIQHTSMYATWTGA